MSKNERLFPYEKAVVLNAIYDALDSLSFVIEEASSASGILLVSSLVFRQLGGKITVLPHTNGKDTLVQVAPKSDDAPQTEWIYAFLDEVQSLIRQTGLEESK